MKTTWLLALVAVLALTGATLAWQIGAHTTYYRENWLDGLSEYHITTSGQTMYLVAQAPGCYLPAGHGSRGYARAMRENGSEVHRNNCPGDNTVNCCVHWTGTGAGDGAQWRVHVTNGTYGPDSKDCGPTGGTLGTYYVDCAWSFSGSR
jgi:hypothetical protein